MTIQQVNLYLPELRPRKEWLTLRTLALSLAGVLLLLTFFHGFNRLDLNNLQKQVKLMENQQVVAAQQLETFKRKAQPLQSTQFENKLYYLRTALRGRERVGQIIEWQNLGNSEGFSRSFTALAQESLATVALEKIALLNGGQILHMKGKTSRPEDVAAYIQRLQHTKELSRSRFGLLSVVKDESSPYHLFSMGYEPVFSKEGDL